jgi:hypothetical protein
MKTAAQYCLLSMVVMISFSTLSVAAPVVSSETGLHSGESTVGFEMVSDLFHFTFEDFGKAGQDGYRSVTVWSSITPFEEGDDRGSFPMNLGRYEQTSNSLFFFSLFYQAS